MTTHVMTPVVSCECVGCVILADVAYGCVSLVFMGKGPLAKATGRGL